MSFRARPIFWGLVLLVAGLAGLGLFTGAFFGWTSFCEVCGAARVSHNVFWLPVHHVKPTAFSSYLDSIGYAKGHRHEWLFAQGSGGLVMCAIGKGRYLMHNVTAPGMTLYLQGLHAYRDAAEFDRAVRRLLEPRGALHNIPFEITAADVATREAFGRWSAEHDVLGENREAAVP